MEAITNFIEIFFHKPAMTWAIAWFIFVCILFFRFLIKDAKQMHSDTMSIREVKEKFSQKQL